MKKFSWNVISMPFLFPFLGINATGRTTADLQCTCLVCTPISHSHIIWPCRQTYCILYFSPLQLLILTQLNWHVVIGVFFNNMGYFCCVFFKKYLTQTTSFYPTTFLIPQNWAIRTFTNYIQTKRVMICCTLCGMQLENKFCSASH